MATALAAEFQFTLAAAGLLTTGIFLTHAGMQIPGGYLADRFGPKPVLAVAMGIVCIGNFALGFAGSYGQLLFWKIFVGLGTGACFVAGARYVASMFAGPRLHAPAGWSFGAALGREANAPGGSASEFDRLPEFRRGRRISGQSRSRNPSAWTRLRTPIRGLVQSCRSALHRARRGIDGLSQHARHHHDPDCAAVDRVHGPVVRKFSIQLSRARRVHSGGFARQLCNPST